MREVVKQTVELARANKCKNVFCDNTIWNLQHRLDLAKMMVANLSRIINE